MMFSKVSKGSPNDFLLTAYLKQTNIVTAVILSIVSQ